MVRCRDEATTYQRRFGYDVAPHLREGIAPLDELLEMEGA